MSKDTFIDARETVDADLLCHSELTDTEETDEAVAAAQCARDTWEAIEARYGADRISDALCAGVDAMEARAEMWA